MGDPRDNFRAVLLMDGTVLVSGGASDVPPFVTDAAEVFDPATRSWHPVGSLHVARFYHSMTLLKDGRVLVAGGALSPHLHLTTRTAAIYDLKTGKWNPIGAMAERRYTHLAQILPDGDVLVAGGSTAQDNPSPAALASAEVFDVRTGRWRSGPALIAARGFIPYASSLLADGQLFVSGGIAGPHRPGALIRRDAQLDERNMVSSSVDESGPSGSPGGALVRWVGPRHRRIGRSRGSVHRPGFGGTVHDMTIGSLQTLGASATSAKYFHASL